MALVLPNQQTALTGGDGTASQQWYQYFQTFNQIFTIDGTLKPTAGGTGVKNALASTITLAGPFVVATHGGTIAFPTAGTTQTMPSASKTLMATDFSNASAAGGDLSGTYPNPTVAHVSGGAITLAGDVTGAANANTVAKINGNTLGSTTPTSGNILVANGSQWASVAMSGAASITSSGVVSITHGAHAQATAGAPAGTLSTTLVMMGLAGSITPGTTGVIQFLSSGYLENSNANATTRVQMYYGTGAAPANGAAVTGTAIGIFIQGKMYSASADVPWSLVGLITGLSVGTTYWFDVAVSNAGTGGTSSVFSVVMDALEQ